MNQFEQDVISRASEKLASLFQQNDHMTEKTAGALDTLKALAPVLGSPKDILPGAMLGIGTALSGGAIGGGLGAITGGFTSKDKSDNVYDPYVFDSANLGTGLGSGLATTLSLIFNNRKGQGNLTRDISALLGSMGTQRLMNLTNAALFKTLNPEGFAKMETDEEDAALANLA